MRAKPHQHRRSSVASARGPVLAIAVLTAASFTIAASLGGCGVSSPAFEDALERAILLSPEPVPPYRKLIADALKEFKQPGDLADLEISEPRWAEHLGGPAWLVCVKFNPAKNLQFYAFFIRKEKVIETRFAVGTDRCGQRSFAPFSLAAN